jgi:hypothetical protein
MQKTSSIQNRSLARRAASVSAALQTSPNSGLGFFSSLWHATTPLPPRRPRDRDRRAWDERAEHPLGFHFDAIDLGLCGVSGPRAAPFIAAMNVVMHSFFNASPNIQEHGALSAAVTPRGIRYCDCESPNVKARHVQKPSPLNGSDYVTYCKQCGLPIKAVAERWSAEIMDVSPRPMTQPAVVDRATKPTQRDYPIAAGLAGAEAEAIDPLIAPITVPLQPAVPEPLPELPPRRIDPYARHKATANAVFDAGIEKIRSSRAAATKLDNAGLEVMYVEDRDEIIYEAIFKIGQHLWLRDVYAPREHKALILAACEAAGVSDDDGDTMWDPRADKIITDKAERAAHLRKGTEQWISDALQEGLRAKDHPDMSSDQWRRYERERKEREKAERANAVDYFRLDQLRREQAAREKKRKDREELAKLERGDERFAVEAFDDVVSGKSEYRVKGLIPPRGITVVWSKPKCGKSFWTFDVAGHIALGWDYRGHRVQQGTVVYVCLEGQAGFPDRRDAFRQKHNLKQVPNFHFVRTALDLVRDKDALIDKVRDHYPDVIVIDTLSRSLAGSESSDRDMTNYIRAAEDIGEALECAIIIVHHCGVDDSRMRGHTSLPGALVAEIEIDRNDTDGVITATLRAAKDMREGIEIFSRLDEVELGLDQDGDKKTSCVVVPVDAVEAAASKQKKTKRQEAASLRTFREAYHAVTQAEPETKLADGVTAWPLDRIKEEFERRHGSDEPDPEKRATACRKAFWRVREKLGNEFMAREQDGTEYAWFTTADPNSATKGQ